MLTFEIRKFLLVESGIQLKESAISLTIGIQNRSSVDTEYSIQYLEYGIKNPRLCFLGSRSESYQFEMILGTSKQAPRQIYIWEKLSIDHLTLDSTEKKFDYPRVWETLVS